ncbi:hypothetical protein RKD38_003120 [Streptomyces ambofaciens]
MGADHGEPRDAHEDGLVVQQGVHVPAPLVRRRQPARGARGQLLPGEELPQPGRRLRHVRVGECGLGAGERGGDRDEGGEAGVGAGRVGHAVGELPVRDGPLDLGPGDRPGLPAQPPDGGVLDADGDGAGHHRGLGDDPPGRLGTQPQRVVGGEPHGVVPPVRGALRQHVHGVEGADRGEPDGEAGVLADPVEHRLQVAQFAGGEHAQGARLGGARHPGGRRPVRPVPAPLRGAGGDEGERGEADGEGAPRATAVSHARPPSREASRAPRERLRSR